LKLEKHILIYIYFTKHLLFNDFILKTTVR
jgi:hypothetical protein